MRFGKQGAFRVSDPKLAHDIEQIGGPEVTVTKIDTRPKDQRKMFTNPGMPFAKYDEFGRRIMDNPDVTIQEKEGENEMPYAIRTRGKDDKRVWIVYNTETMAVKGEHKTRQKAENQLRLLNAIEHNPKFKKKLRR